MKNIDWSNLGFGYIKCDYNIRATCKDGVWSDLVLQEDDHINLHMAAPSLHYGAESFEGLKAYRGVDGKIRLFRPADNARRMLSTSRKLYMAQVPEDLFVKACVEVVKANADYVPPYESGASLYIRPMLIGSDAVLGVRPGNEFLFCVFVSPVGAYFKGGMSPIKVILDVEHDRAAPRGTGDVKCGGNYAASIKAGEIAHEKGYSNVLYVDALERKYIEECGAANFFGIKNGTYATPKSSSILPSITNMSLRQLAEDMGLKVEQRQIALDELPTFEECGACGTAAVISPIGSIFDPRDNSEITYDNAPGRYSLAMYQQLLDIQYGRAEDKYGWTIVVE
ncbi:MAG: branched-chain amino acid aminotransferase [Rikenellaceae bacterium]